MSEALWLFKSRQPPPKGEERGDDVVVWAAKPPKRQHYFPSSSSPEDGGNKDQTTPCPPLWLWVVKQDYWGREVRRWRGRVLWATPRGWALEATYRGPIVTAGGLTFRPGDRMIEFYYTRRWYNLFAVYDGPQGRLKGWYANLATPAQRQGDRLIYRDWELDVVFLRDGRLSILDEEAFAALPLGAEERLRARQALHEIQARLQRGPCKKLQDMLQ